jgi:hypothetical protein
MTGEPIAYTRFFAELETFTCQSAQKYLNVGKLADDGDLFPMLKAAKGKGRTILALLTLLDNPKDDLAEEYLASLFDKEDKFPAALGVNALLGGLATEDDILRALGNLPPLVTGDAAALVPQSGQDANMSQDNAGQNTEYVQSVTMQGEICSKKATVYKDSEMTVEVGPLSEGDKVKIFGRTSECWAIEHDSRAKTPSSAFVLRTDIKTI